MSNTSKLAPEILDRYPVLSSSTVSDALDKLGRSDVIAIDNRGRTDCTVRGSIMTEVAKSRSIKEKENAILSEICEGVPLGKARELHGTLALQTPSA